MKKFQKPVAIIIILSLILDFGLGVFIFKPKTAQALDAGGSWATAIKETVLDAIGWVFSDIVLKRIEKKIIDWGLGRKSDQNEPFLIVDWGEFFKQALIVGTAKFIAEYDLIWDTADDLDNRIKGTLDSLGFNRYYEEFMTYSQYARPTLYSDLGPDRYQPFIDSNYSLRVGGWAGWFSMLKPQNNVFGQILMASYARRQAMEREKEAKANQAQAAKGYKNEEATTKTNVEQCVETCQGQLQQCISAEYAICISMGGDSATCSTTARAKCEKDSTLQCDTRCKARPEISLQTRIKNWGQNIEKSMTDALGKDMSRIISADEISELIGIVFSALLNKAIDGLGLGFSAKTSTPQTRARADYKNKFSYGRSFKKALTKDDIKRTRTNILSSILKAMQSLSRSIISCNKDEMMVYDEWTKNVAEVLEANVESLYVGLMGVNLKPDFEVLDSAVAPYTVYGYSWSHIPYSKMPSECRAITDLLNLGSRATCRNISSGLEPLDPTFEDLACPGCTPPGEGFTYTGTCSQCMYDHDSAACPPAYTDLPWPRGTDIPGTVWQQKWRFLDVCRNWYLQALNRCDECLKKADEKCDKTSSEMEKRQCINDGGFCNNYGGLTGHIQGTIQDTYIDPDTQIIVPDTMGLDFYDKCIIEEKKEACFTCLKEYYIPETYCGQVNDYVVRSIDRYPALVKIARGSGASDQGKWFGPYDRAQASGGGTCDDNYRPAPMDLSLMCRIAPDFAWDGQKLCYSRCRVDQPATATQGAGPTTQEMQDITDFRPHGGDCNNAQLPYGVGGSDAWNATADGTMKTLGKCCSALHIGNTTDYARCLAGAAPPSEEEACSGSPWQVPECYCDEGERFLGDAKTSRTPWFRCPDPTGLCWNNPEGELFDVCRRGCANYGFEVPNMRYINTALVNTNAAPGGGITTVAPSGCGDSDESNCIAVRIARRTLLNKLAAIFKPLMPYGAYAQENCDCNSDADCGEGERCGFAGALCRGEDFSGICEEAPVTGTCDCNTIDDCSISGQYCDTEAPANGDCFPGNSGLNGLCTEGGATEGPCDYIGQAPNDPVPGSGPGGLCQIEAYNSSNSTDCCARDPQDRIRQIGEVTMTCDFSGFIGQQLFLSSVDNNFSDCKVASHICVRCDPSDPGYPNYGYSADQCNNKIPPAQR